MKIYWPPSLRYLLPYLFVLAAVLVVVEIFFADALLAGIGKFGFFALLGLLSCAVLIAISLLIGKLIKREEHYYDD